MDANTLLLFVLCFFVMLVSAFFSASETALFSIPRERIDSFSGDEFYSRRLIYLLLADGQRTLLLLLLCNLFVNITLTGLINSLMTALLGHSNVIFSFIAATVLIITFGEIMPKTGALRRNEAVAAFASPILYSLKKIFMPLLNLMQRVSRFFLVRFQRYLRSPSPFITVGELKSAVCSEHERGVISRAEQGVITNLLDKGAQPVKRFMTHRSQVPFLPHYTTADNALKELVRLGQTYALVTHGAGKRQVVGTLSLHSLFAAAPGDRCRRLAKAPDWVPETQEVADLISFMFAEKRNIACVLDEFGDLSGIFTLDDGLNKVMSPRRPEQDGRGKSDSARVFPGLQEIDTMTDWLSETLLSAAKDARTLNGLLTGYLGKIPKTGERFDIDGIKIYIMYSAPNRIESVLIRKNNSELK